MSRNRTCGAPGCSSESRPAPCEPYSTALFSTIRKKRRPISSVKTATWPCLPFLQLSCSCFTCQWKSSHAELRSKQSRVTSKLWYHPIHADAPTTHLRHSHVCHSLHGLDRYHFLKRAGRLLSIAIQMLPQHQTTSTTHILTTSLKYLKRNSNK